MTATSLAAGFQLLKRARGDRPGQRTPKRTRAERVEAGLWVALAFIPAVVTLVLSLIYLDSSDVVASDARLRPLSVLTPALMLLALIGGRRVARMQPKWAQFQVGLSVGTVLFAALNLRRLWVVAHVAYGPTLDVFPRGRLSLPAIAVALITSWIFLWYLALPTFAALDAARGVRVICRDRVRGLNVGLGVLGLALSTSPWWIWLF